MLLVMQLTCKPASSANGVNLMEVQACSTLPKAVTQKAVMFAHHAET